MGFQDEQHQSVGNATYCLTQKFEGSIDQFVTGQFCGDCWRSIDTNEMCVILFSALAVILVTSIVLMFIYHRGRKQAAIKTTSKSFYYIFAFIFCWMVARTIYYTDAFINYSYTV